LSTRNNSGETPLELALSQTIKFSDFSDRLTDDWISLKDSEGNSMLHLQLASWSFCPNEQIFNKFFQLVKKLDSEKMKRLFSTNNQSETPWHIALSRDSARNYILNGLTSKTIFHKLLEDPKAAKKQITALQQVDREGNTVLHKAILRKYYYTSSKNYMDFIQRLIENSPSETFHIKNNEGKTVADLATADNLSSDLTSAILQRQAE
jgi:hypothetical protein